MRLYTRGLPIARALCRVTRPSYHLSPALDTLRSRRVHSTPVWSTSSSTPAPSSIPKHDIPISEIDAKWLAKWDSQPSLFEPPAESAKPPHYVLSMFPYPSGSLHMGHLRVYTISDVVARYKRMKGYNVLHPMGWDSFGLPAENAAIERGVDPAEWTDRNIESMKTQLKRMGARFDWSRELRTSDPDFYAGTQRLFLKLFEEGLAYRAPALVNWDPVDQTVLANEQVSPEGISWRSGAKVEEKFLEQWMFKITRFAPKLMDDLKLLKKSKWPESVITQQHNWIGESSGVRVSFPIRTVITSDGTIKDDIIKVYTTRLDTILGVQFLALSVSHPLVKEVMGTNVELKNFVENVLPTLPPGTKAGFWLPNVKASNPINQISRRDGTVERDFNLPIFVAPYVLGGMGTSAVMGVPAHDSRDFDFWKENRPEEAINYVIRHKDENEDSMSYQISQRTAQTPKPAYSVLTRICGKYAGMSSIEAHGAFYVRLKGEGMALPSKRFKMRDWLISRQRYWGTPIPIIHCKNCGPVAVKDEDLPVRLPKVDLTGKGGSPLRQAENGEWVKANCPKCGGPAERDTDTMDTFVDSSWYFIRFGREPDPEHSLMPVDIYIGGVEHAILHLLYARFISKFIGKVNKDERFLEPFRRLISQGMVHGRTLSDPDTGKFLKSDETEMMEDGTMIVKATGKPCNTTFEKMSKSKHNGVDPTETLEKYGLDATRAHILFSAPVSDVCSWDEQKIVGMQRWLARVRRVSAIAKDEYEFIQATGEKHRSRTPEIDAAANQLKRQLVIGIRGVTASMEDIYSLNTAVSDLTILTGYIHKVTPEEVGSANYVDAVATLLKLSSPISPAISAECWESIFGRRSLLEAQQWPNDHEFLVAHDPHFVDVNVHVNGKFKLTLRDLPKDWSLVQNPEQTMVDMIFNTEEGYRLLQGRQIKNVIVVGKKNLVNILSQ